MHDYRGGNNAPRWVLAKQAKERALARKWRTGQISPQMKQGVVARYVKRRQKMMLAHGFKLWGGNRLYAWVMDFGPFMKGDK